MLIAPCVAVSLSLDLGANNGNLLKFPKVVYGLTICIVSLCKLLAHRFAEKYKEYNNIVIILNTTLILFFKEKESKEFKVFAADACVVCQNFLFFEMKFRKKEV